MSEFLNRVADGEEFRITRGGRTIAEFRPARRTWVPWSEFMSILETAPSPDEDFEDDLRRIREEMNNLPERNTPLEWD